MSTVCRDAKCRHAFRHLPPKEQAVVNQCWEFGTPPHLECAPDPFQFPPTKCSIGMTVNNSSFCVRHRRCQVWRLPTSEWMDGSLSSGWVPTHTRVSLAARDGDDSHVDRGAYCLSTTMYSQFEPARIPGTHHGSNRWRGRGNFPPPTWSCRTAK